ncbi:MAG: tyrosine-type recombinase/integrase [Chloroflexota bacterium]
MPGPEPNSPGRSLAARATRELSDSRREPRSVRSGVKHWQPPDGLSPEEVRAVIAAASCERDRLLLHVLWATGARISEVLALRPLDVRRDSLVLPNRKNPGRTIKRVYLPEAELGLTGELLLWAREQCLADEEPLFFSRKGGADGSHRALRRGQAWLIVKEASERAAVLVLALRPSTRGGAADPAPVHPQLFRHARVRQIVRVTRSLPLAQRQAGWARLQMAYLTIGDDEARQMMRQVIE